MTALCCLLSAVMVGRGQWQGDLTILPWRARCAERRAGSGAASSRWSGCCERQAGKRETSAAAGERAVVLGEVRSSRG